MTHFAIVQDQSVNIMLKIMWKLNNMLARGSASENPSEIEDIVISKLSSMNDHNPIHLRKFTATFIPHLTL
jgi:hypothetical protein